MAFITALITWIIVGALIGWLASLVSGRTERIGCLSNMVAGEVGAVVGGLLGLVFGSSLVLASILAIGAVVLANKLFTS